MSLRFNIPQRWLGGRVSVVVIGAGGTGSDMLVRLAKLHTQLVALGGAGLKVTVYDADTISQTNCGRQHFSPSAVGLNKALFLVNSINLAYQLDWKAVPDHFDLSSDAHAQEILYRTDLVITCVDKAAFRVDLCKAWRNKSTDVLLLDGGNGRDLGQVVLGHLGKPRSGLRLPNVFDLWPEMAEVDDTEEPSCSAHEAMEKQSWPVNQTVALLMVELLWTLMRQGWIDYHGATFNLAPMRTTPLMIDPDAWSFMGYEAEVTKAA